MADIHGLELEFAKNPTLEACIPLCEAYLTQKRFMEAMVVCKKGIKSAPQDARGRVMLARIYAEQGKGPKAQQEVEQLLAEVPNSPLGLEMLGKLQLDAGQHDAAVQSLQRALAGDPNLVNARTWLGQLGVAVPAAAPAQPPPQAFAPPQPQQFGAPQAAPQAAPPSFAPPQPQQFGQPPQPQAFGQPAPAPFAPPQPQQFGAPPAFGQPQAAPFGAPPAPPTFGNTAAAPAPLPEEASRPLEHVSDFFATETLGFSSDASGIETAGPGRLTILGFVPKSTGSIKTTLFVTLAIFAVAAAFIFYQYKTSQELREINKRYIEIDSAMREDNLSRYEFAVKKGEEILAIDDDHDLTLGAVAYASAVMAVDYKVDGALDKAKGYLKRAEEAGDHLSGMGVAAKVLIAYADKQYDAGLAEVKKIIDAKGSSPLFELEAFRLMNAAKPDDKETQTQLRRLTQSVSSESRIYNYLGWYYYQRDEWTLADKNFSQALQNQRTHAHALIGSALTDLGRNVALQERQKEVEKNLKAVLALPPEELGQTMLALANFAYGQLLKWQGKDADAEEAYKKAYKLDPDNAMFAYRRGTTQLKLGDAAGAVEFLRKAAAKEPNNTRYYKMLAQAQIKQRDFAGAKATLERATQLSPADLDLKLFVGDTFVAEKKFAEAIAAYKKITREDGGAAFSQAQIGISTALRESGKKPEAIKHMRDYLANAAQPDASMQAKLWCELGLNYEAAKEKDAAIESFQSGIDIFRYYADCHYFMCRALGKGQGDEACKAYLAIDPRGQYAADAKRRAGP